MALRAFCLQKVYWCGGLNVALWCLVAMEVDERTQMNRGEMELSGDDEFGITPGFLKLRSWRLSHLS